MTHHTRSLAPGQLEHDLKQLVVTECDKDIAPDSIADDAILIGGDLELDSLDALQIAVAIKTQYGVRIEDGPQARKAMQSIRTLADTIRHYQPPA